VLKCVFIIQNKIMIKIPTFFEHGSEGACSIKDGIFLEGLNACQFLLKDPASW
jgi:hypothetical protein